ncbi:GnsA/GnsB family protein, partial [Escherichia coli]
MRCFILSFIRLLHIIDTTVYQDSHNRLKEEMMNIEELKTKT